MGVGMVLMPKFTQQKRIKTMANLKKTILPEEWDLIRKEATDPACSLSRLFDILRSRRAQSGTQLLNRSWFLAFMMNVCNAKDGKIGTKFRIPVSAEKKPEETPSVEPEETLVSSEKVATPEPETESVSDLLNEKTLFCLQWMYSNNAQSFSSLWTKGGYMKKMCTDAAAELLNLGVITKKNPKRFEPFNWTQILKDFPEVAEVPLEHPEWKATKREEEKPRNEVNHNTPTVSVQKEDPISNTHKKMDQWLLEENHVNGEITTNEVMDELRKLRSPRPVDDARYFIEKWIREEKVRKVAYTSAYKVLTIPIRSPESYTDQMKKSLGLLPSNPRVVQQPASRQTQRMDIHKGVFVIRLCGKDFEINNNSNSSVSLNIENEKVVLVIK